VFVVWPDITGWEWWRRWRRRMAREGAGDAAIAIESAASSKSFKVIRLKYFSQSSADAKTGYWELEGEASLPLLSWWLTPWWRLTIQIAQHVGSLGDWTLSSALLSRLATTIIGGNMTCDASGGGGGEELPALGL